MTAPLVPFDSVFMEELTCDEISAALAADRRTVIVATGGLEQNGPYLPTGKHNYILLPIVDLVARALGALIAPIIVYVPEPLDDIRRYPGTLGLSEDTFGAMLRDIARGLKSQGFDEIIFLADHYDSGPMMASVAATLDAAWQDAHVFYVPEFYNYVELRAWIAARGIVEAHEGYHDEYGISAMMAAIDPVLIRADQRAEAGRLSINGVVVEPRGLTAQIGREAIRWRADVAIAAIASARRARTPEAVH